MINRFFAVTANRVGKEGDLTFTGGSIIADPDGDVLHRASDVEETIVVIDADLSRARDKMKTPRNHVLKDRRPDQYGLLCSSDPGGSQAEDEIA